MLITSRDINPYCVQVVHFCKAPLWKLDTESHPQVGEQTDRHTHTLKTSQVKSSQELLSERLEAGAKPGA